MEKNIILDRKHINKIVVSLVKGRKCPKGVYVSPKVFNSKGLNGHRSK